LIKEKLTFEKVVIYREGGEIVQASIGAIIKVEFLTSNNTFLVRDSGGNLTQQALSTLLSASVLDTDNKIVIREGGENIGKDLSKAIAENVLNGLPDANKVFLSNGAGSAMYGIDINKFKTRYPLNIFTPLKGSLDTQVYLTGSIETVATNRTGNYSNDFDAGGQKVGFSINSVTGSGYFTITGTRLLSGTNVPEENFLEDVPFTNNDLVQYQSVNQYLDVQSIKVFYDTPATISYNIFKLSYNNLRGKKFNLTGYQAMFKSDGNNPSIKLLIQKIARVGTTHKFEIVDLEIMGLDSKGIPLERVDGLRSAGDNRYYQGTEDWGNNETQNLEQNDFDTYFSGGNIIDGTNQEGLIVSVLGQNAPNLKDIDYVDLQLDIVIDNFA